MKWYLENEINNAETKQEIENTYNPYYKVENEELSYRR